MTERIFVLPLDDPAADRESVGGKGAALARLGEAGVPMPPGFHVAAGAYRDFVERHGLRDEILSHVSRVDPDLPMTAEAASGRIAELFERHEVPTEIAGPIRWMYSTLGDRDHPAAVRPSPVAEDMPGLPEMPFAGAHDTMLGVQGEASLLEAVRRCWASLWSARAIEYRCRAGIDQGEVGLGVIVQSLLPADAAGVMCTAARVSGDTGRILLEAAWGLGDPVASGRVTPDTVIVEKGTGRVTGERVADKAVMMVAGEKGGVGEQVVPQRWRNRPVLSQDQAAGLCRLGERIEALCGRPMDIEWALRDDRPYVLQICPAQETTDDGGVTEVWNDSLACDHLWTRGGLGESVPDVMTPCTWSLVQMFMRGSRAASSLPGHRSYGNIGGHFYTDLSQISALGSSDEALEAVYGRLPPGVSIPPARLSVADTVRTRLPRAAKATRQARADRRRLPEFLAAAPERCEMLRGRIREETGPGGLLRLWGHQVLPFFLDSCHMLEATEHGWFVGVRRELVELAGPADANAMLTGLRKPGVPPLATLGPVIGLTRLARGEIDRSDYLRRWGHRGPHEFELAMPRPYEDPSWIEEWLPALGPERDALELMERQREVSRAAWRRFRREQPKRVVTSVRRRIGHWAQAVHDQEAVRSEVVRVFSVVREFVLRAGELTGRREDLFQLTLDEILAVLDGETQPLEKISVRRRTYERYRALSPYPAVIRGRFDPVTWAAGRGRRMDYHDGGEPLAGLGDEEVSGTGATAGVVEGYVRVMDAPEQAGTLGTGEILVTNVAGIGWTPLFPRVAALVTDVGAPLSSAVLVARELGVPAVVGCGNATSRLRTGDRVRVDGERGDVELLSSAEAAPRERLLTRGR